MSIGILFLFSSAYGNQEIPQTIHQLWIGDTIPEYFNLIRSRFMDLNPDWQYNLWRITPDSLDSPSGVVE
jgi:mannosyltransferase OCH1-like enzyme